MNSFCKLIIKLEQQTYIRSSYYLTNGIFDMYLLNKNRLIFPRKLPTVML